MKEFTISRFWNKDRRLIIRNYQIVAIRTPETCTLCVLTVTTSHTEYVHKGHICWDSCLNQSFWHRDVDKHGLNKSHIMVLCLVYENFYVWATYSMLSWYILAGAVHNQVNYDISFYDRDILFSFGKRESLDICTNCVVDMFYRQRPFD